MALSNIQLSLMIESPNVLLWLGQKFVYRRIKYRYYMQIYILLIDGRDEHYDEKEVQKHNISNTVVTCQIPWILKTLLTF